MLLHADWQELNLRLLKLFNLQEALKAAVQRKPYVKFLNLCEIWLCVHVCDRFEWDHTIYVLHWDQLKCAFTKLSVFMVSWNLRSPPLIIIIDFIFNTLNIRYAVCFSVQVCFRHTTNLPKDYRWKCNLLQQSGIFTLISLHSFINMHSTFFL